MPSNDHILHPQPQMTRPRWTDLGGLWGFAYDDDGRGLGERWQDQADIFARAIRVPFPPESPASGIADTGFHPIVWYRTTFTVDPDDTTGALLLHCGAVDYRAHVWVNGQLVATHEGGHTPFSHDVRVRIEHHRRVGSDEHRFCRVRGHNWWGDWCADRLSRRRQVP